MIFTAASRVSRRWSSSGLELIQLSEGGVAEGNEIDHLDLGAVSGSHGRGEVDLGSLILLDENPQRGEGELALDALRLHGVVVGGDHGQVGRRR